MSETMTLNPETKATAEHGQPMPEGAQRGQELAGALPHEFKIVKPDDELISSLLEQNAAGTIEAFSQAQLEMIADRVVELHRLELDDNGDRVKRTRYYFKETDWQPNDKGEMHDVGKLKHLNTQLAEQLLEYKQSLQTDDGTEQAQPKADTQPADEADKSNHLNNKEQDKPKAIDEIIDDVVAAKLSGDKEQIKVAEEALNANIEQQLARGVLKDKYETEYRKTVQDRIDTLLAKQNPNNQSQSTKTSSEESWGLLTPEQKEEFKHDETNGDVDTSDDGTDDAPPIDKIIDEMRRLVEDLENTPDPSLEVKPSSERQARLDAAFKKFVDLSARRRGRLGRKDKEDLEVAKQEYIEARNAAGLDVIQQLKDLGWDDKMLKQLAVQGMTLEHANLVHAIEEKRLELAEGRKLNKFYEFWKRQGRIKKALILGTATIVPGAALGVVGGSVIGGAIGGVIARGAGKGWFGTKLNKEANKKATIQRQAQAELESGEKSLDWYAKHRSKLETDLLTDLVGEQTKKSVRDNRVRTMAGIAIGAASATLSAVAVDRLGDMVGGSKQPSGGSGSSAEVQTQASGGTLDVDSSGSDSAASPFEPNASPDVAEVASEQIALPDGFNETAWPRSNAEALGVSDPAEFIQRTLDEYNARTGSDFIWNRNDGQFWSGNRVINGEELKVYNRLMAELYSAKN